MPKHDLISIPFHRILRFKIYTISSDFFIPFHPFLWFNYHAKIIFFRAQNEVSYQKHGNTRNLFIPWIDTYPGNNRIDLCTRIIKNSNEKVSLLDETMNPMINTRINYNGKWSISRKIAVYLLKNWIRKWKNLQISFKVLI